MGIITRGLLIGGKEVPAEGGRTTDDISPWTGEVYARVAAGTTGDINRAIEAASLAFDKWSKMGAYERRSIFLRAADLMKEREEEGIAAMAGEVGGSRPWAQFNVNLCVEILREAAAAITQAKGQILATNIVGTYSLAARVPFGVIAAISPWDAPYILGIRSIAIPLAMGNTVVMKPSEDAPITCGLYLADILRDAGLPDGVLNVVTNDLKDAGDIVNALVSNPKVRLVNFTGSTNVGRIIGIEAAKNLKPAVLELGGKNALIVLKDANIDHAVKAAVFGAYFNAGQICMSTDRVLVVREIADEFIEKFAALVNSLKSGDPSDPSVYIGPLVNTKAAIRISKLVKDALSKGAKALSGTGEIEGKGETLVRPVLLANVTKDMDIYYSEIFGPATVVYTVADKEEAIAIANDTEYGLTGGIISENTKEALEVAARIETGIFHINDQGIGDEPMAPFGGVKSSGYGHFGGQAGIDNFTTVRWITIQESGLNDYGF